MKFVLNRDFVLTTLDGLSYGFEKGKPVFVAPKHAALAVAIGAEPLPEDAADAEAATVEVKAAQAAEAARPQKILDEVRAIVKRNNPDEFTAGGRPNLRKLGRTLGFEVTAEELDKAWEALRLENALSE